MKDFDFKEATEGKTLDDLVQKIKELPLYGIYKRYVEVNSAKNSNLLQGLVLLYALSDKTLSALIMEISNNLLFSIIDQRLKYEILNESEGNNDEKSEI